MKKILFAGPALAAVLFTIPEAWQLMHQEDGAYIPVVFELLLLGLGFLAALALNLVLVLPLLLLVQLKTLNVLAGLGMAALLSLIGTTIAYAYEIFGYPRSILEPEYLYPLLIPLFVLTACSFWFLRVRKLLPQPEPEEQEKEPEGEDTQ